MKLSGEGLMGDQPFGIDENVLNTVSESIRNIRNTGLELCIVIGGGNFYRGVNNTNEIIRRPVADQAGMLATVINALFLKSALNSKGIRAEILSGLSVPQIAETYSYRAAQQMLADGVVIILQEEQGIRISQQIPEQHCVLWKPNATHYLKPLKLTAFMTATPRKIRKQNAIRKFLTTMLSPKNLKLWT